MKVILAGFSKTGTKTLYVALTQLGLKVYDVVDHFYYAGREWNAVMKDTGSADALKKIYEDVDAVCDIPACHYWDELLRIFPDSKVILMVRDDDDQWERSLRKQLKVNENLPSVIWYSYLGRRFYRFMENMAVAIFSSRPSKKFILSTSKAKSIYRRHNSYVLQNAPKEKLLVYNVKEGWDPLCKFLKLDRPNIPFPHKNAAGDLWNVWMAEHPAFFRMAREMMVFFALLAVVLALCLYWQYPTIVYGAKQAYAWLRN